MEKHHLLRVVSEKLERKQLGFCVVSFEQRVSDAGQHPRNPTGNGKVHNFENVLCIGGVLKQLVDRCIVPQMTSRVVARPLNCVN